MSYSIKEKKSKTANDIKATFRGIMQVYRVSVGVIEALAWAGLVGLGWVLIYRTMQDKMTLSTPVFAIIAFSTTVISLRLLVEGAKYFREVGSSYER